LIYHFTRSSYPLPQVITNQPNYAKIPPPGWWREDF